MGRDEWHDDEWEEDSISQIDFIWKIVETILIGICLGGGGYALYVLFTR